MYAVVLAGYLASPVTSAVSHCPCHVEGVQGQLVFACVSMQLG
jgi:hypothetical protein